MAVVFRCDLSQTGAPLPHVWAHTVGSDHAPVALRADWQRQLQRCHNELGFRYVRFHGLLSDDMGTLISHDGKLFASFFNADQVFDFLLSIGMKPFVELSFMPMALASGRQTVFRYAGNVTPPADPRAWEAFIRRLIAHWVERYGVREVQQWFFEVWNEPNLKEFWTGTRHEYFRFYENTARAIKRVESSLQVGGPATAKNAWIEEFLDFCDGHNVPVDFVSTHHYPTDSCGNELQDTDTRLAKNERSLLRKQAQETRRQARGKPVYYTEWNTSSNPRDPLHDEPYAAAFVLKTVMEATGLVEGYSFWAVSDIFGEDYFPSAPFHGGFGLLNLHGIPKPTYRVFELLHHVGTELLSVHGTHTTVDAWVVRDNAGLTVLLANHALPRHRVGTERCRIELTHGARVSAATVYRIDEAHANPKRLWRRMGEPEYLGSSSVERLQAASEMRGQRCPCVHQNGTLALDITMPPHSVAAMRVP